MKQNENNTELFYDDENIEDILYGKSPPRPTSVDRNLPIKEKMGEIRRLFENENVTDFSIKVLELFKSNLNISKEVYIEIHGFLSRLIPDLIKPILKYNIHDFNLIIKELWEYAQKNSLQEEFGTTVYRGYEHSRHYSEAIRVLQELIDVAIKNKNRSKTALYLNNLAFNYLVEQECQKAAPLFKEAADIFYKENEIFNYYNSMVNYWICRSDSSENIGDIEIIEKEVDSVEKKCGTSIDKILSDGYYWHHRKPYILFAKLKEKKGDIKNAIAFIKKAISTIQDSQTTYLEEDQNYLSKLEDKTKQATNF